MAVLFTNNASSRLAVAIAAGATSLSVTSGEGAKFPSPGAGDWFPLTLIKASGALEILRCTARSGDVLTVSRAQEGTSAQAFSAGDRVELRLTSGAIAGLRVEIAAAQASADASVKRAGDTMTGQLGVPSLLVGSNAAGAAGYIDMGVAGGHASTDARIYVTAPNPAAPAGGQIVLQAAKGVSTNGPISATGSISSDDVVRAKSGRSVLGDGVLSMKAAVAGQNIVFSLVNSDDSQRGQLYADASGILRYTIGFTEKFRVQDGGIVSHGLVYSGNGTGYLAANGDVYGSIWGGLLSNYLSSYFLQIGNLPTANANIGLGGIGSYAFLGNISGANAFEGNVFNGTGLRYYSTSAQGSQPPGNWRCHGICPNGQISVWQRVS